MITFGYKIPDVSPKTCHILYNVLDINGKEILSKWVKKIIYVISLGIYIVEDNNEDELLNKYGYINKDYWVKKYNIITKEDVLLSEDWFDSLSVSTHRYIRVRRNGKYNLLNLNGVPFLSSDADYVSDCYGSYVYCCRNGILLKAFSDGREEKIRNLSICDTHLFEIPHPWTTHQLKLIYKKAEKGIGQYELNYLFQSKYLLFEQCYDKLEITGVHGLYFIQNSGETKLMDIAENILTDFSFKLPNHSYFINGYAIIEKDGKYGIMNHYGNIIYQGYSSVLWTSQRHGLWEMFLSKNGEDKHFMHRKGYYFINYVHDFLLHNQIVCLLEKDGVWYYPDYNNNLVELFELESESVVKGNDFLNIEAF